MGKPITIEGDKTRDETLEEAAQIVEQSTSWGLNSSQHRAVRSFQRFAALAIRKQKSDYKESSE
jgi:hypothetical protein